MTTLTHGELEVMRILWEHGELKPLEIQEKYPRPIKNAALRFQLRVLLEKKHVKRRRIGKAYAYRPATPKTGAFKTMVRRMADVYCEGSATGLIAELIKSEKLSAKDIDELKQFAQAEGRVGKTRKKGGKKS